MEHCLLHIRKTLSSGKNVLFLTPEIGLGNQLFRQFKESLPRSVYLLHSRLTPAQRVKLIQTVAEQKEAVLVVGMRSALLLLDLHKFGLIIVDDEHDFSYKQVDPAPRFHARDVALFAGKHYHIPVILNSSCPSLESEYNARMGKYHTISGEGAEQPQVYDAKSITPELVSRDSSYSYLSIEFIDTLRCKKKKQMIGNFSTLLLQAFEQAIAHHREALLFSHRSAHLEEELHSLLPALRCVHSDEATWKNIGVIALFDPDRQLSRSDFRAHERTYQWLMTLLGKMQTIPFHDNVAPRIILQTEQPEHPLYCHLQSGNHDEFVLAQLRERKEFQYPPFVRLIALRFKHPHIENAQQTAQRFKEELSETGITSITGPFAPYQPVDAKWHTQLLWLRLSRDQDNNALKKRLYQQVSACKFSRGSIQIDVDPF